MTELNPPAVPDDAREATFREQAIDRLLSDHTDLPDWRLERWMELLEDPSPHGRVFAATAAWAMMDVRDSRRQRIAIPDADK